MNVTKNLVIKKEVINFVGKRLRLRVTSVMKMKAPDKADKTYTSTTKRELRM